MGSKSQRGVTKDMVPIIPRPMGSRPPAPGEEEAVGLGYLILGMGSSVSSKAVGLCPTLDKRL